MGGEKKVGTYKKFNFNKSKKVRLRHVLRKVDQSRSNIVRWYENTLKKTKSEKIKRKKSERVWKVLIDFDTKFVGK